MWEEGVRIYGTLEVPNNFPWARVGDQINDQKYIDTKHNL